MPDPAPHKLIIEEREGYLYVLYGGNPLTLEMILETINRVAEIIRARGYTRVLIVRDAPLLESDQNRAMVANLVGRSVPANVRFAIVDVFGNHPRDAAYAAESARRAGWDLTDFTTIEQPEEWLTNN